MKKTFCTFADFDKLDIRVGEVKEARQLPNSKKLLELTVDFGEEYGVVTILTGMALFYSPTEYVGKKYLFIANLEPKPMAGSVSQGMLMSGDSDENGKPVLIEVSSALKNGLLIR